MVNRKTGVLINTIESYIGRTNSKIAFLSNVKRVKKANGDAFSNLSDNFSLGANGKLTSNVVVYLEDTSSKAVPMVLGFDALGELPTSDYNKALVDVLEQRILNELNYAKSELEHIKDAFVGLVEHRAEIEKFMTSIWDKEVLTEEEQKIAEQYERDYLVSVKILKSIK